ncbi:predicted protein [Chaetoceros tenuissimus]|uniref:Uncharacterized protein n=1 Tax=Chaetoceros tenuissimus TaxID=426638 RepID=A0AAD3CYJ6_9STRA|nr:predicted protein [Chaetoceros tenuissimus]
MSYFQNLGYGASKTSSSRTGLLQSKAQCQGVLTERIDIQDSVSSSCHGEKEATLSHVVELNENSTSYLRYGASKTSSSRTGLLQTKAQCQGVLTERINIQDSVSSSCHGEKEATLPPVVRENESNTSCSTKTSTKLYRQYRRRPTKEENEVKVIGIVHSLNNHASQINEQRLIIENTKSMLANALIDDETRKLVFAELDSIVERNQKLKKDISLLNKTTLGGTSSKCSLKDTNLEVIESGILLRKYRTLKEVNDLSIETRKLLKHTWVYHRSGNPAAFDMRYPLPEDDRKKIKSETNTVERK